MSETTTRGIRVQVTSIHDPERSLPEESYFFFEYRVTISNLSRETVQLISRKWIINDANGNVEIVEGPGVIGQQPILAPGESFQYRSFCPLNTAVGSMHGSYQMVAEGGEPFDAEIAPFSLAVPTAVN